MADAPKKLSTQEILAAARAEAGKTAAPAPAAPQAEPVAAEPAAAETPPAAPAPQAAATDKPKSTSDILARARAQAAAKAGGEGAAAETPSAPKAKPAAAKPAAGGAPKSTADILAAARAAAAGKTAPAVAAAEPKAKPAPKEKPAAAAKAAAAPAADAGPKLSVEEMLAAVRPGTEGAAAPKPAKPAGPPPMPARPAPAAKKSAEDETRRNVLIALLVSPFAFAWALLATTTAIATLATARFMLPNVLTEPPSKFKIGPPTDFDLGTVATKLVAQYGIWVVHTDQYKGKNLIYALISVCTHLGCTPSWLEGEQKFKCPCHGSGFYITGINFEGPAPRPLERAAIRLAPDGMLEVDKSQKFQEEMGQWADPTSYYEVVA